MSVERGAPYGLANKPPVHTGETPAERRARGGHALQVAARLLAGAATFFYLSFAFAFVYLKTSNVEGKWRPASVAPVQSWGVAFLVCIVLSGVLIVVAARQEKAGKKWTGMAIGAILLGLLSIAAQIIEYTVQTFGPSNFAYASVFIAWTGFFALISLLGIYWIEITTAAEMRTQRNPEHAPGEGVEVAEHPDRLLPRGLQAAAFFWAFQAGIGVVMWVMVYQVK